MNEPLQPLTPSQFSSIAAVEQSSTDCGVACWQLIDPFTHVIAPIAQTPCPGSEHAAPPPGLPSSTMPLQSSSVVLQASVPGVTSPMHAPHAPPTQVCVPALQGPTPCVPCDPE